MTGYPDMPDVQFIETNGIRMAVFEAGPHHGIPLVLCHGWPELAYSWRHQLPALAEAGYRVIAPDQRGYGFTDRPEPVETYDIHHLTGDLVGLLDAMELGEAIFVGHDWGSILVWHMPLLHPERVAGVIGMNVPFIPRLSDDPIKLMRESLGEDMYIVWFQKPGEAEAVLEQDVARTFRFLMRKSHLTPADVAALPPEKRNVPLLTRLAAPEESWNSVLILTEHELGVFTETYRQTGFTGGINWYRNFTRNWQTTADMAQRVDKPALMFTAEKDLTLPPSMADGIENYVPDVEVHLVQDCGHWTQQEKPDEVNRVMIDWLKRRFG